MLPKASRARRSSRSLGVVAGLWFAVSLVAHAADAPAPSDGGVELLRERVEELQSIADETAPMPRFVPSLLIRLYRNRDFRPIWDDAHAEQVLAAIRGAPAHGLDPRDYGLAKLESLHAPSRLSGAARVDADLALTDSFLRYAYDLRFGKVDPHSLDPEWNYSRAPDAVERLDTLDALLAAPDLVAAMNTLLGHGLLYESLQAWLARYRTFAQAGGWKPLASDAALRTGDVGPRVQELRARLAAEGLAPTAADPKRFDGDLTTALRTFQTRHALTDDGVLGAGTLRALNVPVQRRVDQLRLNLERLRWVARDREPRFVGVNIAGFRVYYVEDRKIVWSARAIVGKPYRQTPIFRATMTYLVVNPDWTVPPTILRKDTLPTLAKNPGYLDAQHMDVIDASGKRIDPATIDWANAVGQRFPYQIRQRPGPWNALGQIKFIFPNEHFVFLHDTPSRQAFEKMDRTFSSGCIRIEKPLELAAQLLKDDPSWDAAALERTVASDETKTILLRRPVPVLIVYLTAVSFDATNDVAFFNDVYGRDDALLAALDAPEAAHGSAIAPAGG